MKFEMLVMNFIAVAMKSSLLVMLVVQCECVQVHAVLQNTDTRA